MISKTSQTFKHSDPLKNSLGSHSQLGSGYVGITSIRSLPGVSTLDQSCMIASTLPPLLSIYLELVSVLDYS